MEHDTKDSITDDNVIDIVSIHQKIHYFHDRKMHATGTDSSRQDGDADTASTDEINSMNFDFYLVQALPILTMYQKCLKDRGKIQFSSSTQKRDNDSSRVMMRLHQIRECREPEDMKPMKPMKPRDPSFGSITDYSIDCSTEPDSIMACKTYKTRQQPFPYVKSDDPRTCNTPNLQDLVHRYLTLVQQYFPELYQQMDIAYLQSTIIQQKGGGSTNTGNSRRQNPSVNDMKSAQSSMRTATIQNNQVEEEGRPTVGMKDGCDHENYILSNDGMYVCEKCGLTPDQNHINSTISFKDINRVNLASKYLYDRVTHFKDCMNQFQGKQNCTIDKKVYEDLIEQFLAHDLIPKDYDKLPREIAFSNISKEHIMLFLKECGHTKHYEDVVLIHFVLTGTQPPDITALENQLLHDFDQLTTLYDKKYRQQDRKNFINTQYVLFQLLKRHKFPCKKEDFNILKTIDRKFYHDDICKSLFEELDWNFNPTF